MPSTSSSPSVSGSSRKQSQSQDEELIPLPQLHAGGAAGRYSDKVIAGIDDEKHDDDDDDDDLVVHESHGLLAGEESTSPALGTPSDSVGARHHHHHHHKHQLKSVAINRAWRERHGWMTRHKYYRPLRLAFFVVLGIFAVVLAVFSLRSALHVSSSHAPGSVSSSSHPPKNDELLASTLRPQAVLSNGTHEWRKTVILISLDGVKPDYVRNYRLKSVARLGLGDELFNIKHEYGEEDEEDEHYGAIIPGGIAVNHSAPAGPDHDHPTLSTGPDSAPLPPRPIPGMVGSADVPLGHLLATSMLPIFPTLTFPNHWTLLTGLYASSHGIVANDFHIEPRAGRSVFKGANASAGADKLAPGRQFYYSDPARSWNAAWWLGQPVWATAERAGIPTAVHMWPGPPVTSAGDRPRYFRQYEEGPGWDGNPKRRVHEVLEWLGKPAVATPAPAPLLAGAHAGVGAGTGNNVRPQLICLYFPDVDKAAHAHGPESAEVYAALESVDAALNTLRAGVQAMNATGLVDFIVVSDHGMAETSAPSTERVVYLDRVLGKELWDQIEHVDGYPSRGIRFKRPQLSKGWFFGLFGGASEEDITKAERELYDRARVALERERQRLVRASLGWSGPYHVYWRDDLPEEWHWNDGGRMDARLAPLWIVPTEGWGFTDEKEMAGWGGQFRPRGNHGYPLFNPFSRHPDPLALKRSMHAIFAASGPSFARAAHSARVKLTHHTESHVGWNMPVLGVDGNGNGYGNGAAAPAQGLNIHHPGLGTAGTGLGGGLDVDGAGTGAALRNVEVYDLVCRLLGVPPGSRAPNNGTAGFWDDYVGE